MKISSITFFKSFNLSFQNKNNKNTVSVPTLKQDSFELNSNIKNIQFCAIDPSLKFLSEFKPLNFRISGENYRGACPVGLSIDDKKVEKIFNSMSNLNIKNLIDVRAEGGKNSEYAKYVKNDKRFKYNHITICEKGKLIPEQSNKEEFFKSLSKKIELINKGGCYVSCGGGRHRTDIFYCLAYIFNPDDTAKVPLLSKSLGLEPNLNLKLYKNRLNDIKDVCFTDKTKKAEFKYKNFGLRNLTRTEFDERVNNILKKANGGK